MRKALLIGSTSLKRRATRSEVITPTLSACVCGYVPKQASRVANFSAVNVAILAYLVASIDLMIRGGIAPVTFGSWLWQRSYMNSKWTRPQDTRKHLEAANLPGQTEVPVLRV